MGLDYLRHRKSKQICLKSQLTTTELKVTTTMFGASVDTSGYREGVFFTRMIANSTNDPGIWLWGGVVTTGMTTTSWALYTTLLADLETTAKNAMIAKEVLPDFVKCGLSPVNITTTTSLRYSVDALLKV